MARKRSTGSAAKKSNSDTPVADATAIVLEGSLDISGAGGLRERLARALDTQQPVVLDAANVERVDTAALQVLTAFFKDAAAQQHDVQWKTASAALCNAAGLLGLQESLRIKSGNN